MNNLTAFAIISVRITPISTVFGVKTLINETGECGYITWNFISFPFSTYLSFSIVEYPH
jgi:hypothetical protein